MRLEARHGSDSVMGDARASILLTGVLAVCPSLARAESSLARTESSLARAEGPWRVGVLADDLPFSRVAGTTTSSTVQGLYVDWWRALGRDCGRALDFVSCASTSDCVARLKRGEVDFVGPAPFVDDDSLRFSRPVNRRYIFAVSSPGWSVATPYDLEGRRVAIANSTEGEQREVLQWHPAAVDVVKDAEAETLLARRKVDVVIANRVAGAQARTGMVRTPLWFRWQHIYARAQDHEILQRVDNAVDELRPSADRIELAALPVGADELLLPSDGRPSVDRSVLAFIAAHPTVRLGASPWEPLTELKDGRYDGLALRIVSHHFHRAGLTPIYTGGDDWNEVRQNAKDGLYDGLGFILVRSASQVAPMIVTEAMIDLPMVAVARSDAEFWTGLDDLKEKRLVGNPSYGEVTLLRSSGRVARFWPEERPAAALELVRSGEVDAWLEYLPVAQAAISSAGATDVKLAFRLGGPQGARTVLQPKWAPVVPLINESIGATRHEDLQNVYRQWTHRQHAKEGSRFFITVLAGVISVLIVGVIVLARRLGREHRTVRQQERALRRAQLMAGIGSVELRPPYDRVYLDGDTSRLLGIEPQAEVQSLDAHIALFRECEQLSEAFGRAKSTKEAIRIDVTLVGTSPRTFTYELAPPQDVDGRRGIMTGTIRDVTEERARLANERALEKQVLHLQKQDAIGRLAGGIAHDFNNILAASIGYTELAMYELPEGHRARRNLEQVMVASNRSRDLVQQILTFSRCAGEELEPIRWDLCVAEALSLMRATTPSFVGLRTHLPSSPIWVLGDPTELTQVLVNLTTNAVDAIDGAGTVTVSLELTTKVPLLAQSRAPNATYARLSVIDTGPGIDEAIRDKIFDPFFTTKGREKGTGLGLSIVHGVLRAHRAHIEVGQGPEGGARFDVLLPTVDAPNTEDLPVLTPIAAGHQSLLLVDDEPAITSVCSAILRRRGYDVTALNSPLEALDAITSDPSRFDLVLTDLTMPLMSGVQLAEKTRLINPHLPVLLLTGYRADAPPQSEHLFFEVLQKPLTGEQLIGSVGRALQANASVVA